jgi:hypothetical protein
MTPGDLTMLHGRCSSPSALDPTDDAYRRFDAKVDLTFVKEREKECRANRVRPSIDPVVSTFPLIPSLPMHGEACRVEGLLRQAAGLLPHELQRE